jgi:hypothetical protein
MNTYILIIMLLGSIATLTVINSLNAPTRKTIRKNKIYAFLFIVGVCVLIIKEGVFIF